MKDQSEKFYWLDTYTYNVMEIDDSVTSSDGEPVPPIDCIKVKEGASVRVFEHKKRGEKHLCINGRALKQDSEFGLFSLSDFDEDNFNSISEFDISMTP